MTDLLDTIAPTPERMAHAGPLMEMPEISQHKERRAYRVVSLVCGMHARGVLDDACLSTYERFERDWQLANRSPSAISGYGERIGGSDERGDVAAEKKRLAHVRTQLALASIGSPFAKLAIVMAVSSRPDTGMPYNLEDIGREVSSAKQRGQAIAWGTATLQHALYQLRLHYEEG